MLQRFVARPNTFRNIAFTVFIGFASSTSPVLADVVATHALSTNVFGPSGCFNRLNIFENRRPQDADLRRNGCSGARGERMLNSSAQSYSCKTNDGTSRSFGALYFPSRGPLQFIAVATPSSERSFIFVPKDQICTQRRQADGRISNETYCDGEDCFTITAEACSVAKNVPRNPYFSARTVRPTFATSFESYVNTNLDSILSAQKQNMDEFKERNIHSLRGIRNYGDANGKLHADENLMARVAQRCEQILDYNERIDQTKTHPMATATPQPRPAAGTERRQQGSAAVK